MFVCSNVHNLTYQKLFSPRSVSCIKNTAISSLPTPPKRNNDVSWKTCPISFDFLHTGSQIMSFWGISNMISPLLMSSTAIVPLTPSTVVLAGLCSEDVFFLCVCDMLRLSHEQYQLFEWVSQRHECWEKIYSRSRSNDTRCNAASNVPLNLRKCCTVRFQPLEKISFILAWNAWRAISRAFAVVVAH